MIRRELAKDPNMAEQSWDRFLPNFKAKNVQRKKSKQTIDENKTKRKERTLFPPPQTPRKVDLALESGEYFLTDAQKKKQRALEKEEQQAAAVARRQAEREQVI